MKVMNAGLWLITSPHCDRNEERRLPEFSVDNLSLGNESTDKVSI